MGKSFSDKSAKGFPLMAALYTLTVSALLGWVLLLPRLLQIPPEKNPLAGITVPVTLFVYPPFCILVGAVAGIRPQKLWFLMLIPPLALYVCPVGSESLVYLLVELVSAWIFHKTLWHRDGEFLRVKLIGVCLGSCLLFYPIVFLLGLAGRHYLASEFLWLSLFLGMSLAGGWLAGRQFHRLFFAPFVPFLLSLLFGAPPALHFYQEPRIPLPFQHMPLLYFALCTVAMISSALAHRHSQ